VIRPRIFEVESLAVVLPLLDQRPSQIAAISILLVNIDSYFHTFPSILFTLVVLLHLFPLPVPDLSPPFPSTVL